MKPYFEGNGITIYHGDCRELALDVVDVIIADPPYGQTSLEWDRWPQDWPSALIGVSRQLWCFGSLKLFLTKGAEFSGWNFAQDIIWEKHNGSNPANDRFRRVHEQAAHFYTGGWKDLILNPIKRMGGVKKTIRRKQRPPHWGDIGRGHYLSPDGGPRLVTSILKVRSCHGTAQHPTQKPVGIIRPLIQYSTNPGGTVFDPFTGSGSVLVAAMELGRKAVGIDVDEKWCECAAKRVSQQQLCFA